MVFSLGTGIPCYSRIPMTLTASLPTATYYPNPAVNYVTLDLPFDAQKVILYNPEGKAVYALPQTATGQYTIPVADLPGGYYSISIWKGIQTQRGKILVIKT